MEGFVYFYNGGGVKKEERLNKIKNGASSFRHTVFYLERSDHLRLFLIYNFVMTIVSRIVTRYCYIGYIFSC